MRSLAVRSSAFRSFALRSLVVRFCGADDNNWASDVGDVLGKTPDVNSNHTDYGEGYYIFTDR